MNLAEHLAERHLDRRLHVAWLEDGDNAVTFPLWSLTGKMVGYQRYRPDRDKHKDNHPYDSRYFTRAWTPVAVWGMESWRLSNTLFVTEGLFDAARLTSRGVSAISVLSNDPNPSVRAWLRLVARSRPTVAVCDNDAAGRKLGKSGQRSYVMGSHDLGDASEDEVARIIEEFSA